MCVERERERERERESACVLVCLEETVRGECVVYMCVGERRGSECERYRQ